MAGSEGRSGGLGGGGGLSPNPRRNVRPGRCRWMGRVGAAATVVLVSTQFRVSVAHTSTQRKQRAAQATVREAVATHLRPGAAGRPCGCHEKIDGEI